MVCGGGEEGGAEADDDATRTSRRRALPSLLGVPVLQPSAGPRTTSSPPLSPSAACRASLHLPPLRVRLAARRSSPPGARPLPLPLARPSPLLAFDLPHRHGESSRSTYSRPTVYRALRTPKQLSAEIYQSAEVQQCRAESAAQAPGAAQARMPSMPASPKRCELPSPYCIIHGTSRRKHSAQ